MVLFGMVILLLFVLVWVIFLWESVSHSSTSYPHSTRKSRFTDPACGSEVRRGKHGDSVDSCERWFGESCLFPVFDGGVVRERQLVGRAGVHGGEQAAWGAAQYEDGTELVAASVGVEARMPDLPWGRAGAHSSSSQSPGRVATPFGSNLGWYAWRPKPSNERAEGRMSKGSPPTSIDLVRKMLIASERLVDL